MNSSTRWILWSCKDSPTAPFLRLVLIVRLITAESLNAVLELLSWSPLTPLRMAVRSWLSVGHKLTVIIIVTSFVLA